MVCKDAVLWRGMCVLFLFCGLGAKHVTPNFEVEAPTAAIAEKVALTAERCREELANQWLGYTLPNWSKPCQVRVRVGQIGAGGATTFSFGGGEVFGWDMTVQGSLERILDSVIPHEVSHTIFACHFRRPLPRWADEGAATIAEEDSERRRQQKLAEEVMPSKRRIPLRELLSITEYPKNMQHVLTLYAEGYLLADFLVQKGGKSRFLAFMQDAHESGWDASLRKHYEEESVEALESKWSQWVIAGSPSLRRPTGELLADAKSPSIIRSQNPEPKSSPRKKSDEVELASATSSGHSAVPRSESVTAPEARRRDGTVGHVSNASKFEKSVEVASAEKTASAPRESRLPRGSHLSHPELRRGHESSKTDHDDDFKMSPSPFAPVETANSPRPKSTGTKVNPAFVQPATLRRK
ncbi:MAG: hypothetical protein DWI21_09565 [Planctomycetota bacterium]|nr:MAG: hypothetical protein DWI21_09565 [Planctomycetota bacterium]GDY08864.1 hypothetical protein LBMAG52_23500 [Planctomycetia bacterium]